MKKAGDYLIPFDEDGNQLGYPAPSWKMTEWRPNAEFYDTLKYDGYSRGRSAAGICFVKRSDGKSVSMFLSDFDKCADQMCNGEIAGVWRFSKRGANYGVCFVRSHA